MLVELDIHDLFDWMWACSNGSHLKQGIWARAVDSFFYKLDDDEKKSLCAICRRKLYDTMQNSTGKEDFNKFLACYDSDNRYIVGFKYKGRGEIYYQNCYWFDNGWRVDSTRFIPENWVVSKEKVDYYGNKEIQR